MGQYHNARNLFEFFNRFVLCAQQSINIPSTESDRYTLTTLVLLYSTAVGNTGPGPHCQYTKLPQIMERRQRPQLPGSTPSVLVSNKSPYASATAVAHGLAVTSKSSRRDSSESHSLAPSYTSDGDYSSKSSAKSKLLRKMINNLPFELRESVGSAVELALQQSEQSKAELDHYHLELLGLRAELKRKLQEIEQLNMTCDMIKKQNEALELTLGELQDQVDTRQHNLVKNRQCINRMAGANRM